MGGAGRCRGGRLHDLGGLAMINHYILTLVTFAPLAGALVLLFFPRNNDKAVRWGALAISLITFALSLHLPFHFDSHNPGFQFPIDAVWISNPNIHYHLGVDGISLWLVLLTTFLVPL